MKTEANNPFRPTLKKAMEIQDALMPLGYEVTGIRKDGGYSYLLYLSEIESVVRINTDAAIVDNINEITGVNNSDDSFHVIK